MLATAKIFNRVITLVLFVDDIINADINPTAEIMRVTYGY